jgi:hypothetical protein
LRFGGSLVMLADEIQRELNGVHVRPIDDAGREVRAATTCIVMAAYQPQNPRRPSAGLSCHLDLLNSRHANAGRKLKE